jgi:hypothetical protein
MSTDLERRLRDALHADAQRARLVNPDRPRTTHIASLSDTPLRRRPGRRLVALAAAAIVVVAVSTTALLRNDNPSRVATTVPTTSGASAAIEQYASVVRDYSAAIGGWIDQEESCQDVECRFRQYVHERYVGLRAILANFDVSLSALPSPPDEIAALVEATKRQINRAANGIDQGLPCRSSSPQKFAQSSCYDTWSEATAKAAYKRLPSMLAAWNPYTGNAAVTTTSGR